MKLNEMLKNISCEVLNGSKDAEISHLAINWQDVTEGSLFVCIKGISVDRHEYISKAYEQGAAAVIVEKDVSGYPDQLTIIKVENARLALTGISSAFYGNPEKDMKIIGVTGTKGKTSVADFLSQILYMHGKKTAYIGTIGVLFNGEKLELKFKTPTSPDTIDLYRILSELKERGAEYVVMEASSIALDLYKLDGINFEIGIFINLTHDHLDYHKTMEDYLKAKARLFKLCKHGVINADDEAFKYIINNSDCGVVTYSIEKESDLKAKDIVSGSNGVSYILGDVEIFIPIPGRFTVYNSLAVIGAALVLGMTMSEIKAYLKNIKGVPGRIEPIKTNAGFNVYVDYAHTPDSIYNILRTVREFTKNRVIIVFGCGGDRDRTKRPVMGKIASEMSDYCIITSDNPRSEDPLVIIEEVAEGFRGSPYESIPDRKDAIFRAIEMAEEGDSVIIAGKGHEDYQELADKKIHFDDKETALQALAEVERRIL